MNISKLNRLIRRFQEVGAELNVVGMEHMVAPLKRVLGRKLSPDEVVNLLEDAVLHGPQYAWFSLASVCSILLAKDIPKAIETLRTLLKHPNIEIRMCAVFTLAEMAQFIRCKQSIKLHELRQVTFGLLLGLLSEKGFIQLEAIRAMCELGDPRALEPLIGLLRDRDNETRWHTASALGKLGDKKALPALRKLKRLKGVAWEGKLSEIAQKAIEQIERENSLIARTSHCNG